MRQDEASPGPIREAVARYLPAAIFLLWLCEAAAILTGLTVARHAASLVVALIALVTLAISRGASRWSLIVMGILGITLTARAGAWDAALQALSRAAAFSAFLACLYGVRSVVQTAPALRVVQENFVAFRPAARRGALQLLGLVFAVPLAIGAMSVVAPLVEREQDIAAREDIAGWAMRGLGLSVLFSPFTMAMGLVTASLPGLDLFVMMALGGTLAALLALTPHLFGVCRLPRHLSPTFYRAMGAVLLPVLVLIAANLTAMRLFGLTPIECVILLVPVFAVTVAALRGREAAGVMFTSTRAAWSHFNAEIAIFVGALVLAAGVTATPEIVALVGRLADGLGPAGLIILTLFGVAVPTTLGVHMVVPATILLTLFGPAMPDMLHTAFLGLAALLGWAYGAMAAFGSIAFLAASSIFGVSPRSLALGPNLRFMALAMLFVSATVLLLPA